MKAVAHLQLLASVWAQRAAIQCRMFTSVQMAAAVPVDAARDSELVTKTSSEPWMQDAKSVAAKTLDGIKVSKDKDPSDLAAMIANSTRKGVDLNLLCLGAAATNVAVKSIVISRSMLKDRGGLDVAFRPELRDEADTSIMAGYKLRLTLSSAQGSLMPSTPADQMLMVGAKSKSAMLAGAMAHRIREGRPVALRGMGAGAVAKAVLAACKTRTYLENEKKDIRLVPEFVKITSEKFGETTACVMHVIVEGKQGQGSELIETVKNESEAPLPQQAQPEQSQQAPEEPQKAPEEPKQAPQPQPTPTPAL